MHEATEWEQQEDGHAQYQMNLVGPGQACQHRVFGTEGDDALCPLGQHQHGTAIGVRQGKGQGDKADDQLHPQYDKNCQIGTMAGQTDAWIGYPAVNKQAESDETQKASRATGVDGNQLLGLWRYEGLVDKVGRKQTEKVPEEQEQDAHMEQIAAPAQLSVTK